MNNTGTIYVNGGNGSNTGEAVLTLAGSAGLGIEGVLTGSVNLSGNSLIEFASGQVTSITAGATLSLQGPSAFVAAGTALNTNSALNELATNAGTFSLASGAKAATTGDSST